MDPDAVDSICGRSGSESSQATDYPAPGTKWIETSGLRTVHGSPDDPLLLDFSTTTNPAIPKGAAQAYQSSFAAARSYPSDSYCDFRLAVAEYVGCEPGQVIPTAGRPPALRLICSTTLARNDSVLLPEPSWRSYERETKLQGAEPTFVPYAELLDTDPEPYDLVVADIPNNPTGRAYDPRLLSAFADRCQQDGTPLVVDEAFLDFTSLPTLAGREGVIVIRSLSKIFGFPGLRAGYVVANGTYRDRLDVTRPAWGLSEPAAALAEYCLQKTEFVEETRERVESERERLREHLEGQFEITPSSAPYLLLDAGSSDTVDEILQRTREQDIVVRDARTFRGLDAHIRVSVRHPDENDKLLTALTGN